MKRQPKTVAPVERKQEDVLPAWCTQLLMLLWLLLLGGRWVVTPMVMSAEPEVIDTVTRLDRGILLQCYLVLLAVTLVVLALRFARQAESRSAGPGDDKSGAPPR